MADIKGNYYAANLNAQKLFYVYDTKYPEIKQYLESEIAFVRSHLKGTERVLELGAGYGRIIKELAQNCKSITGIDISEDNVKFGKEYLSDVPNAKLLAMNAHNIEFSEQFDVVLCLQNALSAMKIDPLEYIKKIMTLLSPGGRVFISSYSAKFWEHRLAWFREQSEKGLLGEIDMDLTKDGLIVCKDGFCAKTYSPEDMNTIGKASGFKYEVTEVDNSSIFLVVCVNNTC